MPELKNLVQSRIAECAVVTCCVSEPSVVPLVFEICSVTDFLDPDMVVFIRAAYDLYQNGGPIDRITVEQRLQDRGLMNDERLIAWESVVSSKTMECVPSAANAEYYAKIVRDRSRYRQLARKVEAMRDVLDEPGTVDEQVQKVKNLASGLDGEYHNGDKPILVTLADVEVKPMKFLWRNRIPVGMLSFIQGDPSLGKSFLSLYIAAKVTTGGMWPDAESRDDHAPLGSVILLTAEDDLSRVVRPRLDALGADVAKVVALEAVKVRDEDGTVRQEFFSLQYDLPALQEAVRAVGDVKLVIVDPLSAYLGHRIDSHRDSDVRTVLMPLVQFAEDNEVAVLGIMHLNKTAGSKALYRGLGSIAFNAAARAVWLVTRDPDDPKSHRRLLTPSKEGVLIEPTGLAFQIHNGRVEFENEPVEMSSDEALGQTGGGPHLRETRPLPG